MTIGEMVEMKKYLNCEYCGEPNTEYDYNMGAGSHFACWDSHCKEVRARGDQGKSYLERQNKYGN